MPVSTINHKGKSITYIDYKHCKTQTDVLAQLDEAWAFIQTDTNQYLIADFENAFLGPEYMKRVKPMNDLMEKKYKKRAVLGINGAKKILLNGFNLITKNKVLPFDTVEQAKEYLVN